MNWGDHLERVQSEVERSGDGWGPFVSPTAMESWGVDRQIRKHLLKHLVCKVHKAQDLVGPSLPKHHSTTSGVPSNSPSHH